MMNLTAASAPETRRAQSSAKAVWLKRVREWHSYLGTFFAPSIIFFAFSGALQLFGLHEARPGSTYQPPAWVAKIGSVHKDQTIAERRKPPRNAAESKSRPELAKASRPQPPAVRGPNPPRQENKAAATLKFFFLAMSFGLIFTTLLGIYMSFKFGRSPTVVWSLLAIGTVLPIALVALTA